MIIIAHGNDTTASRNFYIEEKQKAVSPITLDGPSLDYNLFYQTIEGGSLFEDEKNIFVENFLSGKRANSADLKQVVDLINNKKGLNLFFWEPKELTKAQVSQIKNAEVRQFSYPQILFNFLDNIRPQSSNILRLFNELKMQMETELILYMIVRQFRLMVGWGLGSNIDEVKRMAPWQQSKIGKQSKYFTKDQLLNAYRQLYKIDYETKFGLSAMPVDSRIDIFLASL